MNRQAIEICHMISERERLTLLNLTKLFALKCNAKIEPVHQSHMCCDTVVKLDSMKFNNFLPRAGQRCAAQNNAQHTHLIWWVTIVWQAIG